MYKTWRNNQRRLSASVSLSIVILVVAVSTSQLASVVTLNGNPFTSNDVYAKYSNDQAQSLVNECGISDATGVNCGINSPHTQADGTVSTPMNFQISGGGEQGPPGPQGPKGDKGDTGDTGPAGPTQELQSRSVQSLPVDIEAGESDEATATCEDDEIATGGGLELGPVGGSNTVNPSSIDFGNPTENSNGWTVSVDNPGPEFITISAIAQCTKLVDAP